MITEYHGTIFLVGPMGAGKSTVGKRLARTLNLNFLDIDQEIVERSGVSIPTIFEMEGEAGFRRREKLALKDLAQQKDSVIATGGGIVLDPENRSLLKTQGKVIYLYASLDHLTKRTANDKNRPLLQGDNPRQRIEAIMAVREPLYQEVADISLDTTPHPVRAVIDNLLKLLNTN